MTDNTLPEVGSRWAIADAIGIALVSVSEVRKRGRGYQVWAARDLDGDIIPVVYRLADFRKQAKPA